MTKEDCSARCQLYIKSKKAFCKFERTKNSSYCAQHCEARIPCPVDGSHSVAEQRLWKHLRICQYLRVVARDCLQPFYAENYALAIDAPPFDLQLAEAVNFDPQARIDRFSAPGSMARVVAQFRPERMIKPDWNDSENIQNQQASSQCLLPDVNWLDESILIAVKEALAPLTEEARKLSDSYDAQYDGMLLIKELLGDDPHALQVAVNTLGGTRKDGQEVISIDAMIENQTRFKHILQTLEMCARLRDFMGVKVFDSALVGGDWIELGAGKGGLMRAVMAFAESKNATENLARYVLIERERRRRPAEKRDTEGHVTKQWEANVLRLHLDIVDFDLGSFVSRVSVPRSIVIPWPLKLLAAIYGPERFGLTDEQSIHTATLNIAGKLENSHGESADLEPPQIALSRILSDSLADRPTIILAKHLCGFGSTLAIQSTLRAVEELVAKSTERRVGSVYLMLAPCCYHACIESDFNEVRELLATSPHPIVRLIAENISAAIGWSTGAEGQRLAIGRAIKDGMLASRVKLLQHGGAGKISVVRYCSTSLTKENTLLLASFNFGSN